MNIEKYFCLAKSSSELSDYTKKNIKIGAVLVYKNRVVANGFNTDKTNPLQAKYNKYRELVSNNDRNYKSDIHNHCVHAEMKCLIDTKDMDINWSKVSIFIYRQGKNGKLLNCFPCPSCKKALLDRGIKNIFYTNENGYNYERWYDNE